MISFEAILYIVLIVSASLYMRNRIRAAVIQIRIEDALRESIREAKQKRKIDELYGRDRRQQ